MLDLIVEHCRKAGADSLDVSWLPGRGSPEPLYLRYGFAPTGEIVDEEIEARLALSSVASATSLNTAQLPTTVT